MKVRDVAIVAAVLLVGGFAVADALWNREPEARPSTTERLVTSTAPKPLPLSAETAAPVPAPGWLVFTDARDCRLREASVGRGLERALPLIGTSCALWGPTTGYRVAFGSPGSTDSAAAFELVDLGRPDRLMEGGALVGPVVWTADGARAAWCETATNGYELDLADQGVKPLDFCPRTFVEGGRLVSTRDRALVLGARVVATASGHIEQVASGRDGSLALVLEGGRIERRGPNGGSFRARLPVNTTGPSLVFAPDTCAVAAVGPLTVSVVDLGCFRGRGQVTTVSTDNCINRREEANSECARYPAPRTFVGRAAAWSPDGNWLAVAEPRAIAFHRVAGGYRVIRWRAQAASLVWLG
ncbi:MAG: hypothetical protein H0U90_01090 [Actinobacteria bacterium]|nr:hypothetical protein [Actinomycetota bacterium]